MPLFGKPKRPPRIKTPEEVRFANEERQVVLDAKRLALAGDEDAKEFLSLVLPAGRGRGRAGAAVPTRGGGKYGDMLDMLQVIQHVQQVNQPPAQQSDLERITSYLKAMKEFQRSGLLGGSAQTEGGSWREVAAGIAEGVAPALGSILARAAGQQPAKPQRQPAGLLTDGGEPQQDEPEEADVNLFRMFQLARELRQNAEAMEPQTFARWLLSQPELKDMGSEWADVTDDEVFVQLRAAKDMPDTPAPLKKTIAYLLANPAKTVAILAALRSELGLAPPTGPGSPVVAENPAADGTLVHPKSLPVSQRTAL